MPTTPPRAIPPTLHLLLAAACALAAGPARADKFGGAQVDCEQFFLWKHTPVLSYAIPAEHRADYETGPDAEYFRQAAQRTAAFCDRTSALPQQPLGPPRRIRGVWFQSDDGQFKVLFDLDRSAVDASAGVVNQIGDRHAAQLRDEARHEAQLAEIRTRDARERELRAAREQATRDKAAADLKTAEVQAAAAAARDAAFLARPDLQLARLGTKVTEAHFTTMEAVRANPFHFRRLGLAVVRIRFNRMLTDSVALFGNELAPLFVHLDDVDRFTRSGETVLLAMRVVERGEAERSYGSVPEIILSMMKAEPVWVEYVGAYTCPGDDCGHVLDVPPPA